MSVGVGVEVDALALMLDGAINDQCDRFNRVNVQFLVERHKYSNPPPLMERAAAMPGWADVAQAILELEANADAWLTGGPCVENGLLARKAWDRAPSNITDRESIATRYLEAAALLRDGWRPRGWRAL